MHLERVSTNIPKGLTALIEDLGNGENGFGGTAIPRGELTLEEYIQHHSEMNDFAKLQPGHIPRTFFWFVDEAGEAIGIVRMWHYLNKSLKERTGHISYYIRRDKRSKGYGQEALHQALIELGKTGEKRGLLIADLDNTASVRVIQANGGSLDSVGRGADGTRFGRYWIELD